MKTMYSDNNLRQRGNVKAVLCFGDFADLIKSFFHIWKEGLVLTLPGVRDKSLYKLKVIFGLEKSTLKILVWENVYKEKDYQEQKKLVFTVLDLRQNGRG